MQPLLERYGMTEIGMALSNPYEGQRMAGTVGQPLPGVGVRISALPRDGTATEDTSDRRSAAGRRLRFEAEDEPSQDESGELRVRGPCLFKEYWQRPQATADAFDEDGFFRTGVLPDASTVCLRRVDLSQTA